MTTNQSPKARNLGRGLSSLIGEDNYFNHEPNKNIVEIISIDKLMPGKYQPRRVFYQKAIEDLASSIKNNGLMSPIIVRKEENSRNFQIVAGERRWRASKIAGLNEVPVIIKELTDSQALELALIENIQRQDLNIIEEAEGYDRLIKEFNYTQEKLAEILSKSRTHITNYLRLLLLPKEIKEMLENNQITMGHARALINLANNLELANKVISEHMSVRDLEKHIRLLKEKKGNEIKNIKSKSNKKEQINFNDEAESADDLSKIEDIISQALATKVEVKTNSDDGGAITIYFQDNKHLDELLDKLLKYI